MIPAPYVPRAAFIGNYSVPERVQVRALDNIFNNGGFEGKFPNYASPLLELEIIGNMTGSSIDIYVVGQKMPMQNNRDKIATLIDKHLSQGYTV